MNLDSRKIFIISIISICILAIILGVCFMIANQPKENKQSEIVIDTESLTQNFNNIFDNQIDYQGNNIRVSKSDNAKELVYTIHINQEKVENLYELDVNIPCLNINNTMAETINGEISSLFYDRVEDIMTKANKYTSYSVKYKSYVNDNILSLVIIASLKEENNQRVIMKTYNYNLSSNSRLNINEVLQYRNVSGDYVQTKINEKVKSRIENTNNIFLNIDDNMYKLENTNVYFLGEDKAIYIIYPYGNQSYTSQMDLLVI